MKEIHGTKERKKSCQTPCSYIPDDASTTANVDIFGWADGSTTSS